MPMSAGQIAFIAAKSLPKQMKAIEDGFLNLPLYELMWKNREKIMGSNTLQTHAIEPAAGVSWNGYSGDDPLTYIEVNATRSAIFPLYEMQIGLALNNSALLRNRIALSWDGTPQDYTDQEAMQLISYLESTRKPLLYAKKEDFHKTLWGDGTLDPLKPVGISGFITSVAGGTLGGIPRTAIWDNRRNMAIPAANLLTTLDYEFMELRKYQGPAPKHVIIGGADVFIEYRKQIRDTVKIDMPSASPFNQTYDLAFAPFGGDGSKGTGLTFQGIPFIWDRHLDTLGWSKRFYVIDMNAIRLRSVSHMDDTYYRPAMVPDQFVYYEGWLWAGGMVAERLNTSAVYSLA